MILIVDDDKELCLLNCQALKCLGVDIPMDISVARTLEEARFVLQTAVPEVILLEAKLPDGCGFEFCREIRAKSSAHIIFLTGLAEEDAQLEGLESGGDDYLLKPYNPELLCRRLMSALRRLEKTPRLIERDGLVLDTVALQAFADRVPLGLTSREYSLLLLFMLNENKILSGEDVYRAVWKTPLIENKDALKNAISKLRRKLEKTCYTIDTKRGRGYVFLKS